MKQRLSILLLAIGLIVLLVSLNALTYVQKQEEADSELAPNRSTYNPAATGTQALYTLLQETGRRPTRWLDSPEGLITSRNKPEVFVMIGSFRRPVSEEDAASIRRWVAGGGRLVIIDREPPRPLRVGTASLQLDFKANPAAQLLSIDPSDQVAMTTDTPAAKPVQPSVFTAQVNSVQPSMFASSINVVNEPVETDQPFFSDDTYHEAGEAAATGPVVHIAQGIKNVLVDVPYGSGRVTYLSDPYIVSNGGLNIVDNAQLAVNLLSTSDGTVAFDEYHQGYGANANRLLQFFEGTPVIAIFGQSVLFIALLFFSQSRRFARPVPQREPDRLSKLEYISAMAELQQRADAYDLAMENIYGEFRRRVSRSLGLDPAATGRRELAEAIASRVSMNAFDVYQTMAKSEAIIQGEPTKRAETVELAANLREIEEKLGTKRTSRGKTVR
jgi:hypothetical protein